MKLIKLMKLMLRIVVDMSSNRLIRIKLTVQTLVLVFDVCDL